MDGKRFLLTILCAVLLPAAMAQAELSPEDEQAVKSCEANFVPGQLSPEKAQACLDALSADRSALYARLEAADPIRASDVEARANTLVDLKKIFTYNGNNIEPYFFALSVKMNLPNNALGLLGLNMPRPLLAWADKYCPRDHKAVERGLREWPLLTESEKRWLSSHSFNEYRWQERTTIAERRAALEQRSAALYAEILKIRSCASKAAFEQIQMDAQSIWLFLTSEQQTSLSDHLQKLSQLAGLGQRIAEFDGRELPPEYAAVKQGLAQMQKVPLNKQLDFLDKFFDKSQLANAALPLPSHIVDAAPFAKYTRGQDAPLFSAAEASLLIPELKNRMIAEVKGTQAGNDAAAFYEKNPLAFKLLIKSVPGSFGVWNGEAIAISQEGITAWIIKTGIGKEKILKDPAARDMLARALAPTFIHESMHQRQEAAKFLQQHQQVEIEAHAETALFVMEKARQEAAKGNMAYVDQINEQHIKGAKTMEEDGLLGIKRSISPLYMSSYKYLENFEGMSARNFVTMSAIEKELAERAKRNAYYENNLDAARNGELNGKEGFNIPNVKTAQLKAIRDAFQTVYPAWLMRISYQEKRISDERAAILGANYAGSKTPPEIGR